MHLFKARARIEKGRGLRSRYSGILRIARSPGWENRFPDDDPFFEAAITELNPRSGSAYWTQAVELVGRCHVLRGVPSGLAGLWWGLT